MHSKRKYVAALLVGAFVLAALSTPSQALTPCEKRQKWEQNFTYIDKISLTCRVLTTVGATAGSLYLPFPTIASEVGNPLAQELFQYAISYGVNLKREYLDKHYVCRIVRAANALHHQPNRYVKKRILQYGLCPPTSTSCQARVKAIIFDKYGLTNACAQT